MQDFIADAELWTQRQIPPIAASADAERLMETIRNTTRTTTPSEKKKTDKPKPAVPRPIPDDCDSVLGPARLISSLNNRPFVTQPIQYISERCQNLDDPPPLEPNAVTSVPQRHTHLVPSLLSSAPSPPPLYTYPYNQYSGNMSGTTAAMHALISLPPTKMASVLKEMMKQKKTGESVKSKPKPKKAAPTDKIKTKEKKQKEATKKNKEKEKEKKQKEKKKQEKAKAKESLAKIMSSKKVQALLAKAK